MSGFQIKSYIKFLLKSQNQHGLHSPFVYQLVTECLYDKKDYSAYDLIKNYRNDLLRDRTQIEITDFGAGSKVFKSNLRPVFSIAKKSGITLHRAKLLFRLTNYLNIKNALELGTSLGIASAAISANKTTALKTIEGCKETAKIAQHQLRKYELDNAQLFIGSFQEKLEEILTGKSSLDMVYFDGDHQKKSTLQYFEKLLPYTHNNSVFIFDDIYWSPEMLEAWNIIKKHSKVRVSIDTYHWGIIFFRKEQAKQDFRIRL